MPCPYNSSAYYFNICYGEKSSFFTPLGAPPPPPPPIGGLSAPKNVLISQVPLPTLNWLPLENAENTIFKVV